MRLKPLGALKPETPEPQGTFTGWFLPGSSLLVDATYDRLRVWDVREQVLLNQIRPAQLSIGRPNGGVIVFPNTHRVITVHENAVKPFGGKSLVIWQLPEMRPVFQRTGHAAIEPGIALGAQKRHFVTYSGQEASPNTPGLIAWDLQLRVIGKWPQSPKGEPLAIEDRGCIADSRCRTSETGIELRTYDGRLLKTLAEDAPVTHQIRAHENQLWLFQEEGVLDIWDLDSQTRVREVNLGHSETMRDDFPMGAVVCMDDLDSNTVATLGTDGNVKFWSLPEWTCLLERPFEMLPLWIDVDRESRLLAVGFAADGIELFEIV